MTHVYKVRKAATKSNGRSDRASWSIAVPREIGEQLAGHLFEFRLTDEGMLYVPLSEKPQVELPAWAGER